MNKIIKQALYIINNNETIRNTAKHFNISKSVLHRSMNIHLKKLDYNLYLEVKKIFLEHNKTKHINGGIATKMKYKRVIK